MICRDLDIDRAISARQRQRSLIEGRAPRVNDFIINSFSGGASPPSGDPYWSSVALLMYHGLTGGSVSADEKGHTMTNFGSVATTSAIAGTTGGPVAVYGSGKTIYTATATEFQLGNNDYSMEAVIYLTGYSASYSGNYAGVILGKDNASFGRSFLWGLVGTASSWTGLRTIHFPNNAGSPLDNLVFNYSFALNTVYIVAATRYVVSGTRYVNAYVNGTQVGAAQVSSQFVQNVTSDLSVGAATYAGFQYYLPGYIGQTRLTNGVARYTGSSYAASYAPFPNF